MSGFFHALIIVDPVNTDASFIRLELIAQFCRAFFMHMTMTMKNETQVQGNLIAQFCRAFFMHLSYSLKEYLV